MTDQTAAPDPGPTDSLKVAFASGIVAQAQAAYINTLIENGSSPEVAVRLAESTTAKLIDTASDIIDDVVELIKVVGQNAPAIAQAVQSTIAFIDEMENKPTSRTLR